MDAKRVAAVAGVLRYLAQREADGRRHRAGAQPVRPPAPARGPCTAGRPR